MNDAYLLIGGNIGERQEWLSKARILIGKTCGEILESSAVYETEAWGKMDQAAFLNQALHILTQLSPGALMNTILDIEEELGRKREEKYGPRTIDIDILFYNDLVIVSDHLTIPHPEIQNRRFALECMNEIAPGKNHPLLQRTIKQLLASSEDPLKVKKIN